MISTCQWPEDPGRSAGPGCNPSAVLRAALQRELLDWTVFRAELSRPGVAVRIDAGNGLTDRLRQLADSVLTLMPPPLPLVLLPLVGPSFGFAVEGRFVLGEPAKQAIADLAHAGFPLGLLADALVTFADVLASPVAAWKTIAGELAETGIALAGAGAPYGCDLPAMLSAIWFWRASGRLAGETVLRDLNSLPLHGFEWEFEVWDDCLPWCDGILAARIDRITTGASPCFVAPLNRCLDTRFERRFRLSADLLLHSDDAGWRAIDGASGAEQRLDNAGAVARLAALPRGARAVVAIDPRHCVLPHSRRRELPRVHPLPWPCDNFLAVASDADWTTRPQATRTIERVCDDLGLPFAGSSYLTSLSRRWPAWSDVACGGEAARFIADRVDEGTADTIHGLAWSFEARVLAEGTGSEAAASRVHRMQPAEPIADAAGIMLLAEGRTPTVWPALRLGIVECGWTGEICPQESANRGDGRAWAIYPLPGYPLPGPTPLLVEAVEIRGSEALALRSWRLLVVRASRAAVAAILDEINRRGASPPVFTTHGGGQATVDWGQLRTQAGLRLLGYDGRMALDAPGSPFRALDLLREAGVAFFNPIDILFSEDLPTAAELLRPETGQDGTRYYAFARYRSARWDAPSKGFAHGKHVATAEGFAASVAELRHRFAWSDRPVGAILYTHLGNRIGNQDSPRLGWGEATHMAWETLAATSRTGVAPDAGLRRIWVTTPGTVLAFAALVRGVEQHLTIAPEGARIRSWYDEHLGHAIPDPARWGTAWLHGLSLTLPTGAEPRLTVDDRPIDTVTLDREPNSGATILTVVDADERINLIPGPIAVACGESRRLPVAEGSLRNVTHWGFCVSGAVCGTRLGLETASGMLFDVRIGDRSDRGVWAVTEDDSRHRTVWLSLEFRRRRAPPDRTCRRAYSPATRRRANATALGSLAGAAAARMASRSRLR